MVFWVFVFLGKSQVYNLDTNNLRCVLHSVANHMPLTVLCYHVYVLRIYQTIDH